LPRTWQAPFWWPAIFIYDRVYMFRPQSVVFVLLPMLMAAQSSVGQSGSKAPSDPSTSAQSAASLAESGHCAEALPALKKSVGQVSVAQVKDKNSGARLAWMACAAQ